ncbi:MAG TPA: nitrate reductase cytochrome c-type subunit [Stellaceae bacterium]|nr:nitrate reductase cytochrome c-type subunit [Stellaceae bacterium]
MRGARATSSAVLSPTSHRPSPPPRAEREYNAWVRVFGTAPACVLALGIAVANAAENAAPTIIPRLTGESAPMSEANVPPLDRPVVDDLRLTRNFPEQPPVIPHSIDGYQLTLNTNRCLSCHKREFTEGSGAPMISLTHYIERDGAVLSDIAPRRYFCTLCHVQQTDARPLVPNRFRYPSGAGARP